MTLQEKHDELMSREAVKYHELPATPKEGATVGKGYTSITSEGAAISICELLDQDKLIYGYGFRFCRPLENGNRSDLQFAISPEAVNHILNILHYLIK
jgi:hypothetical protein